MVKRLILKERLDSAAAEELRSELDTARGEDLVLDAAGVQVLGGRCLELLMCAHHIWSNAGNTFSVDAPSDLFLDNLSRFGLSPRQMNCGENT